MSVVTAPDELIARDLKSEPGIDYDRQIEPDRQSMVSCFDSRKNSPLSSRTIRKRNLTERGRLFAIDLKFSQRNVVSKKLKTQIQKMLSLRDSSELETLETERDILDRLKEDLNNVQSEYDNLLETEEERESSYRWYDVRDREYFECRMKICEQLQSMERRSQVSERSSRRSVSSHVSHTSKVSKSPSQK